MLFLQYCKSILDKIMHKRLNFVIKRSNIVLICYNIFCNYLILLNILRYFLDTIKHLFCTVKQVLSTFEHRKD